MLALTVQQPWAAFIALGWKALENRGWKPSPTNMPLVRNSIAIHAGVGIPSHEETIETLRDFRDSFFENADVLGLPPTLSAWRLLFERQRGRIVATARLERVHFDRRTVPTDQRQWWVGPCGWELADVRRATSEPVKGKLGLWQIADKEIHRVDRR